MALVIDDTAVFPEDLDPGVEWGPAWLTTVITTGAGFEQRNQQWSRPRRQGTLSVTLHTEALLSTFVSFFEARGGRLRGFRLKDPKDYVVVDEPLDHDGATQIQLTRTYTSGGVTRVRSIYKPVVGSVTLKKNGLAFTLFSIDYNSGTIFLGTALTGGDTLSWSGQYHIPVRFDTDLQTLTHHSPTWSEWSSIPIVELRGTPTVATPAIVDTFSRANTTPVHSLGTAETGQPWLTSVAGVGSMGINGNQATVAAVPGGEFALSWLNGGTVGRLAQADAFGIGADSPILAIRVVDPLNFVGLLRFGGNLQCYSYTAGVSTLVADAGAYPTPTGETWGLEAVGNTINVYVDGVLEATGTSSAHAGSTNYGIGGTNGAVSMDNFSVD